ncbi:MAG: putative 4-mercaptohistidine N1-methyltransferase [Verrucomicrobiales bacterium]|nr:putative 4-mercaptohistidine N1-methyltransferase [Verrucomicrobiales bacterium]
MPPVVPGAANAYYDSDRAVAEYLLFHYADDEILLPWPTGPRDALHFPQRCVSEGLVTELLPRESRALDAGCAVGRAAFELSKVCHEVIGLDASSRFIEAAHHLKQHGRLPFRLLEQGTTERTASASPPPGARPERVRFEVGNALALNPALGTFDLILAANLLDRVPSPADLVRHLASRLRPGGQLILTSPYTWLEEYTPSHAWLSGSHRSPLGQISDLLEPAGLRLHHRADLPFLIREHARKFQWSVAELSTWVRDPSAGTDQR